MAGGESSFLMRIMRNTTPHTDLPWLVVSDTDGNIFEIPRPEMTGMRLRERRLPEAAELISLPFGSALFQLPGRLPVGYDRRRQRFVVLEEHEGQKIFAVGAFIAPAHTQTLLAAYESAPGAEPLPLFAYSAAGWRDERFYTAGVRVDTDIRQDPAYFNARLIEQQAALLLKRYPGNRLIEHLVDHCVRLYGCPAAQNLALGRWEAPIPTSPSCNARCVGCISKQPEGCVPETQTRITFVPTPEEIAEYTVPHLDNAPRPIVSFGQGCEGEPLIQSELLEQAIRLIRSRTAGGTINLNTNASRPEAIDRLCTAGLDSLRISLNSARREPYRAYYRPAGYDWPEVIGHAHRPPSRTLDLAQLFHLSGIHR